jgi:hypothetical protein
LAGRKLLVLGLDLECRVRWVTSFNKTPLWVNADAIPRLVLLR